MEQLCSFPCLLLLFSSLVIVPPVQNGINMMQPSEKSQDICHFRRSCSSIFLLIWLSGGLTSHDSNIAKSANLFRILSTTSSQRRSDTTPSCGVACVIRGRVISFGLIIGGRFLGPFLAVVFCSFVWFRRLVGELQRPPSFIWIFESS